MDVIIDTVTFDCLADVAYADAFLLGDVQRATAWASRTTTVKGRGLVSATRAMLNLPWNEGMAPDPAGADEDIPTVVKDVCSMYASDIISKPRLYSDAGTNSNIKLAKAGSAQVEFFRPVSGGPPFPTALWGMLVAAGLVGMPVSDGSGEGPYITGISGGHRPLYGRYGDCGIVETE